jgi:hypothetical protein
MICASCDGEGWTWPGGPEAYPEPCPDCDGCGLAYCCEGARAEPEKSGSEGAAKAGLDCATNSLANQLWLEEREQPDLSGK